MNYVKSCLIITMLLGVQIGYSQDCDPEAETGWNCDCNEDTWQEYYNSEGHNMVGCYLAGANLAWANLCNLAGSGYGECEQPEGIADENGDGYDDASFDAGYVDGATSGDLNLDGVDNVLDVVILVDNILNP